MKVKKSKDKQQMFSNTPKHQYSKALISEDIK